MKFVAKFDLKHERVPIDYHRIIISFFKKSLQELENGRWFNDFFRDPNCENLAPDKKKNYTYNVFFKNSEYRNGEILTKDKKFLIEFSSADDMTALIFYNAFMKQRQTGEGQEGKIFKMPLGNEMILMELDATFPDKIQSENILVQMKSPLIVKSRNDEKYIYNDKCFVSELKGRMKHQLAGNYGITEKMVDEFCISPCEDQCKKVVVKCFDGYIDGSLGQFVLKGHPALLNQIAGSGLGSRTGDGFGYFKVLHQWN